MLRIFIHYGIHFLVPVAVAFLFFKEGRKMALMVLLGAILIDIDHIFADPVFDHNRCSINFHPLHTYWAMAAYTLLLFFKRTRLIGIALLLHILADLADCYLLRQAY